MSIELDVQRFYTRLRKLYNSFQRHNNQWGGATSFCLHRSTLEEDDLYKRSIVLHQWLFGYELPDTIVLVTGDGDVWICATQKKCDFVKPAVGQDKDFKIHLLLRNKNDNNAQNYETLLQHAQTPQGSGSTTAKVGLILKERPLNKSNGGIVGGFEDRLDALAEEKLIELIDVAPAIALVMGQKDNDEQDLMKKSSVLSNKVMKHGFAKRLEEIIEEETTLTHDELAGEIDKILEDPNKINLKLPETDVSPCYYPIIQSGGKYDIRISAQSTTDKLRPDIIIASLGARYKMYCSNIARTFLVDPPKKVSETYELLLEMQEACLKQMKAGNQLKAVYKAAVSFLQGNGREDLIAHLPKILGFSQGLDFRDSTLSLSSKNGITFKKGMTFCLAVGFQNLELSSSDKEDTPEKSAVKKLSQYSLLISDMVSITDSGGDVLTKFGKAITDIAYNVNDEDDDSNEDEADDDDADAKLARKLSRQQDDAGERRSRRLAKDSGALQEAAEGTAERERKQINLMTRRNEQRLREIARESQKSKGKKDGEDDVEELETYKSTKDYPSNVQPNQVKVDMASECVLLPLFGNPVPFHISTIKNVVLPDPDNATLLRINFYTAGMAVGKDAPANMAKLVPKYAPYASFIRELTFRSLDGHNLVQAFRQISELRKRARAQEVREMEEATLVKQEKLVRLKNERVPRLSDLTMRPVFAGKKTQGNLEAHTNGLRFISTRSEVVDIMYNNIKYAIFQPCENEIMVLIHFHLKNPIMIGKKKHLDIQFFTEVVDASQAVDNGRRSMYDPDEMDDEQRERQLRKRLNQAFKEFCKKVDAVAKKHSYHLEFDIPYRDLGFTGNPHKEMVQVLPTLNCLVNLTETPFFVVDLDYVDHVHFERVTYMSKAFDMILINKDFNAMPWRVDMIPNGDKESIQEWLTDMEITYTEGPMNLNWKSILATAKEDERFYMNTEEDEVTEKEAGWEILRMYGRDDEEEEDEDEDDSEFGDDSGPEEEDEEADSEENLDDEDFDSEEEESFDGDEELEEQGMDWDEMEMQAAQEDKRKRRLDVEEEVPREKSRGGGKKRRR